MFYLKFSIATNTLKIFVKLSGSFFFFVENSARLARRRNSSVCLSRLEILMALGRKLREINFVAGLK
jgi:hypothetical protein